jgi:ATP-dependent RNA helicase DDX5/DBP2
MTFATIKATKRKEKKQVATFQEGRLVFVGVTQISATTVWVDDKYKHMITPSINTKKGEGAIDDTWED